MWCTHNAKKKGEQALDPNNSLATVNITGQVVARISDGTTTTSEKKCDVDDGKRTIWRRENTCMLWYEWRMLGEGPFNILWSTVMFLGRPGPWASLPAYRCTHELPVLLVTPIAWDMWWHNCDSWHKLITHDYDPCELQKRKFCNNGRLVGLKVQTRGTRWQQSLT